MIQFKRWLVALDRTEMDTRILEYVKFMSTLLEPQKIYLLHVVNEEEEVPQELLEADEPVDEQLEAQLTEQYGQLFGDTPISIEVCTGEPLKELLHYSKDKLVDLVFVGRKGETQGRGILPKNFARQVPSSIIFVPEGPRQRMEQVLVPTDFSDNAYEAAEEAIRLVRGLNHPVTLYFQHVFDLPTGYYYGGKSREEFIEIMRGHAQKHFEEWREGLNLDGLDTKVELTLSDGEDRKVLINQFAEKIGADLILIGARGRTGLAAMVLGSVTEKLIQANVNIPQMVVKRKGEKMSLLDALKEV